MERRNGWWSATQLFPDGRQLRRRRASVCIHIQVWFSDILIDDLVDIINLPDCFSVPSGPRPPFPAGGARPGGFGGGGEVQTTQVSIPDKVCCSRMKELHELGVLVYDGLMLLPLAQLVHAAACCIVHWPRYLYLTRTSR